MKDEKDSSGTSLTEGASVSVSAPDTASHATPKRKCPWCHESCAQAWCGRCERLLPTHTSGPWTVTTTNFITYVKADTGHKEIAVMYAESGVDKQANAHLISAAPELLAVLRDLEWIGLNDGRGVTHRQCPACSALQSRGTGHNPYCGLAAAIAKAEGR